jgi:hypothetical protein
MTKLWGLTMSKPTEGMQVHSFLPCLPSMQEHAAFPPYLPCKQARSPFRPYLPSIHAHAHGTRTRHLRPHTLTLFLALQRAVGAAVIA